MPETAREKRLFDTVDDMAATLFDIIAMSDLDEQGVAVRNAAHEAIERWKAGRPWPRLNNPNPPFRPMPGIDF